MDVKLIRSQQGDWEGLYVNGHLIEEEHEIGRFDLLRLSEEHGFKCSNVKVMDLSYEDQEVAEITGSFPENILDFISKY